MIPSTFDKTAKSLRRPQTIAQRPASATLSQAHRPDAPPDTFEPQAPAQSSLHRWHLAASWTAAALHATTGAMYTYGAGKAAACGQDIRFELSLAAVNFGVAGLSVKQAVSLSVQLGVREATRASAE